MPKLISESEVRLEWADINARITKTKGNSQPRSKGIHLSGIIKAVMIESGLLKDEDQRDEMPLCMAIGMAWEEWAVGLWPKIEWQPGECSLDKIIGSPDGVTTGIWQLEEFKATWKSRRTRTDIITQKIWLWQMSGYCKMMCMLHARLHVLWINGIYPSGAPTPEYRTYTIEFSQQELDTFWTNVILKNKHKAIPE